MSERQTITPWEKNPRKITKQRLRDLKENLAIYGDLGVIVVNRSSWETLSGNQRCRAIDINNCPITIEQTYDPPTEQGTVAVGYVEFEGERFGYREVDWDQKKMEDAAIIANVAAGAWDFDLLAENFGDDVERLMGLGMGDLLPSDFLDRGDAARTEREGRDEPDAIDHHAKLREKWQTEPDQLWIIPSESCPERSHRLLIADSTSADDVRRLMNGERARLFATDPPYLVDYTGTNHPDSDREVQDFEKWDTVKDGPKFFDDFIAAAMPHLDPRAAWYCWHASSKQRIVEEAWERAGAFVHQQIIWSKANSVLTRSFYMWAHEPCFFGWVRGKDPHRRSKDHLPTVWHIDEIPNSKESLHPTSKPIRLFQIPIEQHTRSGEICYEPFSGSGSQHVAAETLGRLCYGMERAPEYAAVILERLEKIGLHPRLEEEV